MSEEKIICPVCKKEMERYEEPCERLGYSIIKNLCADNKDYHITEITRDRINPDLSSDKVNKK